MTQFMARKKEYTIHFSLYLISCHNVVIYNFISLCTWPGKISLKKSRIKIPRFCHNKTVQTVQNDMSIEEIDFTCVNQNRTCGFTHRIDC